MNPVEPDLLKSLIPFPFAYDKKGYDGYEIQESKPCKKCKTKDCFDFDNSVIHLLCPQGFSCYPISYNEKILVLFGLIDKKLNTIIRGIRRKSYKSYLTDNDDIKVIQKRIEQINLLVERYSKEYIQDSISFLHEIRTSVGIVLSCSQQIIDNFEGDNFDQKLKNADKEVMSLFQSIDLLQEQLNLTDVIANPESITYGHKNSSDPHRFLHKMSSVFRPKALKKNIQIYLHGRCNCTINAYNSFQLIPLILLDNAIKYSYRDRDINIYIEEMKNSLSIKFSSYGNIVLKKNRERIFQKYYRGERAKEFSSQGMGLGLYLAKKICDVNNSTIVYSASPDDGEIGRNDFIVTINT